MSIIFGACATVDEGEVLVPIRFGEAEEPITEAGLHGHAPWKGEVFMPTREKAIDFTAESEDGSPIQALSAEGATVDVDLTVLYHIDATKAAAVYERVGVNWESQWIIPFTRSSVRDCVPQFTFEDARTSKRGEAADCIRTALEEDLTERGVLVAEVLLRDMRADANLQAAIDAKLEAQNAVKEAEFIEQQTIVESRTKEEAAKGDALATLERAKGEAKAIIEVANAQAQANEILGGTLVGDILTLRLLEALGNKTVVYLPAEGLNITPVFDVESP